MSKILIRPSGELEIICLESLVIAIELIAPIFREKRLVIRSDIRFSYHAQMTLNNSIFLLFVDQRH